jgi:hypothetical protein
MNVSVKRERATICPGRILSHFGIGPAFVRIKSGPKCVRAPGAANKS